MLFTWYYTALVRRRSDPPAPTYVLGFDSKPIRAEKSLYDLAKRARSEPALAAELARLSSRDVVDRVGRPLDDPAWVEFQHALKAHLDAFGHMVYNLDFVNPVPADDLAPLIDAVRFYLGGGGTSPYARQAGLAERREQATARVLERLDPLRAGIFRRLLGWAQSAGPMREDALADVGLAWPELRRLLHELGRRLAARGVIDLPDQVSWLQADELERGLTHGDGPPLRLMGDVQERQELWRGRRRVTPPQILPRGTWMDLLARTLPANAREQTGQVLSGVGASAGRVTAVARVMRGPENFGELQPGEVLVAAITTPAWTSLFARAAAVVTDIGGPLSHSSIVAREYGIPAVLGTNVATRRITSGQIITVDGDVGTVTLPDVDGFLESAVQPSKSRMGRTALALASAAISGYITCIVARGRWRSPR
jgi:rifampicin phosphotransferase